MSAEYRDVREEQQIRVARIAVRSLMVGWGVYVLLSWLSSLAIFYSDIALSSDLHRVLPIIARAEDYFVAHGQLDFLKKTAWIYEKDLALLAVMLVWLALTCRFGMRMSFVGFFRWSNYKGNYLGLASLAVFAWLFTNTFIGPDEIQSLRGVRVNKLYAFRVFGGAFHFTLLLPTLVPIATAAVVGFLEPIVDPKGGMWR